MRADGTDSVNISAGAKHLYTFDWLFGFTMSIFLYTALSWIFPAKASLSEVTIYGNEVDEGMHSSDVESASGVGKTGIGGGEKEVYNTEKSNEIAA